MSKALLVIDYTNDFVAEDGALTCGAPGREIEHAIVDRVKEAVEKEEEIFFAVDLHELEEPDHPEAALFPPHNIRGEPGRELFGKVKELYESTKDRPNVHWLDKTRYSAFAGTPLQLLLRQKKIKTVVLAGVCTDICILHTAVDAYNEGFRIHVDQAHVASFNKTGHEWALSHFKNTLGAEVKR
jgi:nicotinamidase-related amidase